MKKLLIATNNKAKVEELQALLKDTSIELILPSDINLALEVVENGKTYAENATRKAMAFMSASNMIALADDSGLEVDALGGMPGLYSARYANKPDATDADRRIHLLHNLQGKPRPWIARFHATIAIAKPGARIVLAEGECEGEIIPEERGLGGFGYDPVFFIPDAGKTMAELSMDEKNRISHRARAIMKSIPTLEKLFNN